MSKTRPYLFYDVAVGLCPRCFRKAEGKILVQGGQVLLRRRCPQHGWHTSLLADDADYWLAAREKWIKPSELPLRWQTPIKYGCPYDCGLCPDHEQHTCLAIVELTDACNLRCPVCYADSGPHRPGFRPLAQLEAMLDAVVESEGTPDVVQLSGGEPTLHPQFFEVLDAAKARPIRHLMLNTNGLRLARDPDFAERLAAYQPGFEVYLQWDSTRAEALQALRGADLRAERAAALAHCEAAGLDVTLVVTVQRGVNDGELGEIVAQGLASSAVRGVTFQPVQRAGRVEGLGPEGRLTLTEVRRKLLEQCDIFTPDDVVPVPCHPDGLAMAYALRTDAGVVPLTSLVPREVLLAGPRSTIAFEKESPVRDHLVGLFSTSHSPDSAAGSLRELLCCLPRVGVPEQWGYERVFRVVIMQFLDADSLELRSVKKSCVHIVQPDDLRLVPFDTYNLLYRDGLEAERLAPRRAELEAAGLA